jgi:hypothetical protein
MAKNFASTTAAATTKPARKSRAKKADTVTMNSLEAVDAGGAAPDMVEIEADTPVAAAAADADTIDLDALLADPVMASEEPAVVEQELSDADLEAAVTRAEATELMMAAATPEGGDLGAAPSEEAVAEGKTKRTPTPRKHYSDKVERLKDRVGESLAEYTVLTTADALVDEAELSAVMERTLEIIRQMNSKEKNRASNFIEFLSGKKAKLNNVLERVLKVLERDGHIQTGAEGNVIKDLLARPYSMASARAMGGNTIGMYADLKVIVPDGKGKFVANPDSLLLAKARALLAVPAAEEPAAAAA